MLPTQWLVLNKLLVSVRKISIVPAAGFDLLKNFRNNSDLRLSLPVSVWRRRGCCVAILNSRKIS